MLQLYRNLRFRLNAHFRRRNLTRLAQLTYCDKWGSHWYTPHYQRHFERFRKQPIRLLEIGVGGYDHPNEGGASLRMWKHYFRRGQIFAIDLYDKSALEEDRIQIFQGSQDDAAFLEKVAKEAGPFDLIIDDGSHLNAHVIKSFQVLFPHLKEGGIYAVEDTQTAYWPSMGGSSDPLSPEGTMTHFFQRLTDCLNHAEYLNPGYQPSHFDREVVAMHFYHNLIFIEKGCNDEGSNIVVNNKMVGDQASKDA